MSRRSKPSRASLRQRGRRSRLHRLDKVGQASTSHDFEIPVLRRSERCPKEKTPPTVSGGDCSPRMLEQMGELITTYDWSVKAEIMVSEEKAKSQGRASLGKRSVPDYRRGPDCRRANPCALEEEP